MTELAFGKYARKGAYHWDEYAGGLLRLNAYTKARYDLVVEMLKGAGIGPGMRVLDLGCGDAALTGLLARRLGAVLTGVDTEPLGVELGRSRLVQERIPADLRLITGYDTGLPAESLDAVVCSDVIEHVGEPTHMLREIGRVLRPGGVAVITTPIRFTETPLDPHHVQEWFPGEFKALCERELGGAVSQRMSHPTFWYELYTLDDPVVGRIARLLVNLLARVGCNPFLRLAGRWRGYTTQLVLFRKPK